MPETNLLKFVNGNFQSSFQWKSWCNLSKAFNFFPYAVYTVVWMFKCCFKPHFHVVWKACLKNMVSIFKLLVLLPDGNSHSQGKAYEVKRRLSLVSCREEWGCFWQRASRPTLEQSSASSSSGSVMVALSTRRCGGCGDSNWGCCKWMSNLFY